MIYQGDCLEVLKSLPDNSIDSCVTDPPYGLSREPDIREVLTKWMAGEDYTHRGGGFMGKTWDSFVPGPSIWREIYRVLKPGAHLLCFAGTRTQDLMTISLRLAGFEIRDVVEWLYFQGFPKSMDIGKAFDNRAGAERHDAIKGGHMGISQYGGDARNNNAEMHYKKVPHVVGKGAMSKGTPVTDLAKQWDGWGTALKPSHEPIILARKPLEGTVCDNVERWGTGALNIGACRIPTEDNLDRPNGTKPGNTYDLTNRPEPYKGNEKGRFPPNAITTEPDMFYSKYFNVTPPELCKKASKRDRNSDWLGNPIDLEPKETCYTKHYASLSDPRMDRPQKRLPSANNHPTVKPTELMAWLVRLITPPGGTVLDPFAGSGSTLVAAKREGFSYVGIEREGEYVEIARARVGENIEGGS